MIPIWFLLPSTAAVYLCGNSTSECDLKCMSYVEVFPRENNESAWNLRHESIARVYKKHRVKVSVEIGILRGGLS